MTSHAKPISWPPSEHWDGADGEWSSFSLRVGQSEQIVRVLPSTAGNAVWVVSPRGCLPGEAGTSSSITCAESRGGLFNTSHSASWTDLAIYSMELEVNLGFNDTADYGLDTVALGLSNATGGPYLSSRVVAAYANDDYYVGMFGLNQQPSNFSTFNNSYPSFLTTLKTENLIPSLSWAYTAGARYQSKGTLGSLTLGGYDNSRIVPNNVSFSLAQDVQRDLVVGLQGITVAYENGAVTPLLPNPIWTFIDSTIAYIYLPIEACRLFESSFGLEWNTTYQTYFVDDTLHDRLLAAKSKITFRLGNSITGGEVVDIVLPYASFDLQSNYPVTPSSLRYFPLVRATNESQYTLGRTFLQEAYIVTNYEQSNFAIYQTKFESSVKQDIMAIPATATEAVGRRNNLAPKVWISFGSVGFVLLMVFVVVLVRRKVARSGISRHQDADLHSLEPKKHSHRLEVSEASDGCSVKELDIKGFIQVYGELPDNDKPELLDQTSASGSGNNIAELSSPSRSAPVIHELMTYRSSGQTLITQDRRVRDRFPIMVSTKMSRQSTRSAKVTADLPSMKTYIYASRPDDVDLDRSLPPTPISESVQVSPIVATFQRGTSTERGSSFTSNQGADSSHDVSMPSQMIT